jgi:molybdopterin-guanine dinucleotide biosynthesis protein MobB
LDELRERLRLEVDIILTEGYKRESYPKIEVFRQAHGRGLLCSEEEELIAIASDSPIEVGNARWLHIDDAKAIADFLEERFSLKEKER